jgi:hypothetical protein
LDVMYKKRHRFGELFPEVTTDNVIF